MTEGFSDQRPGGSGSGRALDERGAGERRARAPAKRAEKPAGRSHREPAVGLRHLFEESPLGIVLVDPEGRLLDSNPAFSRIFGYSREEALGQPIHLLIVPEEAFEESWALVKAALRGSVAEEVVRRRRDGSLVTVHVTGYPLIEDGRLLGAFGLYSVVGEAESRAESGRLQSAAMQSAANAILIANADGEVVWMNRAMGRLTGYRESDLLGASVRRLIADPLNSPDPSEWERIPRGSVWRGQVRQRHESGRVYDVEQTVTPIETRPGVRTHFVIIHEDLARYREAERRYRQLARHDQLTDLPNRYMLDERLAIELERAALHGTRIAVMVLDLDHFKDLNDTRGHLVGDQLLVAVAQRLRRTLRDDTTLWRLGGDEFAVLQTDFLQLENADGLARRLVAAFEEPFEVGGRSLRITASVGIAATQPGEGDGGLLLKHADLALYRAKDEGRDGYRFHTAGMDRGAQERMRLGQELFGALDRRELFLVYQPQIELPAGELAAVEALVRWRHPRLGVVEPGRFIPIAEGNGLIVPIGRWVLETACRQAARWSGASWRDVSVSVNCSAIQFKDPGFGATVEEALTATGLAAERLELEITEGALMSATPVVEENLAHIDRLGVRLALDDFGKGYSSLAYLRRLRLQKLKIDRSFVADLETEPSQAAIVGAMAAMARNLGLQVVAEGVETREQLRVLLDAGYELFQGFYFFGPAPAELLERKIVRRRAGPVWRPRTLDR